MKTMLTGHDAPYTVDASAKLLGEVISWELPRGLTISHADLMAKLAAAGLDPALARDLCQRHAFVRAVRAMAASKLVDRVVETKKEVTFQFSRRDRSQGRRVDYVPETTVTLAKATGDVTCPDAAVEARARVELSKALGERKRRDVTRLLKEGLFAKHADLFTISPGAYFCPIQHADLIGKADAFVQSLGGVLHRLPVADGTPQGDATVRQIVTDDLEATLLGYDEAIQGLTSESRKDVVERARERLQAVADKVAGYDVLLGNHRGRLEDYLAWLGKLLEERTTPPAPVETEEQSDEGPEWDDEDGAGESLLGPVPSLVGIDPATVDVEIGDADGLVPPQTDGSLVG